MIKKIFISIFSVFVGVVFEHFGFYFSMAACVLLSAVCLANLDGLRMGLNKKRWTVFVVGVLVIVLVSALESRWLKI
jgi:hypothetical protein